MNRTVIHFIDSDTHGGCEEIVLSLLNNLHETRWTPVLFHHDEIGLARLIQEVDRCGIARRVVPSAHRHGWWKALREFVRHIRDVQPAVFHAHLSWPLGCFQGLMAARVSGVRNVVATAHVFGPDAAPSLRGLRRRLHPALIHRYIAVSEEVKRRLRQELGVPKQKICVVHNGLDIDAFVARASAPSNPPLPDHPNCPVVLTPARLHKQKGHADLLRAAALVPDAVFMLAGDGPERRSLEELAVGLGVASRVHFLGTRADIPSLLAGSDVFVLPSLYEGLPVSVLEAMAVGTPVIATAVGGTDEVVEDGVTGVLAQPGQPADLASKIAKVIGDSSLAARLATSARRRVRESFSLPSMVDGVLRVYDEVPG